MRLDNEFVVPVPVPDAWAALQDIERIAPCMPGASIESVDGDDYVGVMKIKLGPIAVTYRGTMSFQSKDEAAHVAVLRAAAREARGSGSATATITASLREEESGMTRVLLATELDVTGRPAQFGRGVMADVSGKILDQFAQSLAAELAGPRGAAPSPAAEPSGPVTSARVDSGGARAALGLASVVPWQRVGLAAAGAGVVLSAAMAVLRRRRPMPVVLVYTEYRVIRGG